MVAPTTSCSSCCCCRFLDIVVLLLLISVSYIRQDPLAHSTRRLLLLQHQMATVSRFYPLSGTLVRGSSSVFVLSRMSSFGRPDPGVLVGPRPLPGVLVGPTEIETFIIFDSPRTTPGSPRIGGPLRVLLFSPGPSPCRPTCFRHYPVAHR